MCGIFGIVGNEPVTWRLIDGLKRLDYRGYDSAGVATIHKGVIERRRAAGKLINLQRLIEANPLQGTAGMAHTRWATHGVPNETNSHPHYVDGVCIVHNGIIENFSDLRQELVNEGAVFETQTDTEVIVHVMIKYLRLGLNEEAALLATLGRLTGAYAFAMMLQGSPSRILLARHGPPLAVGHGDGEMYFGSDAIALSPFTNEITYLNDGDCASITCEGLDLFDFCGRPIQRPRHLLQGSTYVVDKGNHRHFMEKEIYEQPEVVSHVLGHYVDFTSNTIKPDRTAFDFQGVSSLAISACGTAFFAGAIGKYWFESYARLAVEADIASEFRYRPMPSLPGRAALFISQSGETADTLASLQYCRENGLTTAAVVNTIESTIAREADTVFPILAGLEIGVASTKAFTCQLTVLACLAIAAARERQCMSRSMENTLVQHLAEMPRIMGEVLNSIRPRINELARQLSTAKNALYIGRGASHMLAMEGALKLKEISYIHAEGYAAGELKHGPIALIDAAMTVIAIAPHDGLFEKTMSNVEEVAARGGRIILITDEKGAAAARWPEERTIVLPNVHDIIAPMVFSLPIQLLAYQTAVVMGTDVDQPRNLAKSVTVE